MADNSMEHTSAREPEEMEIDLVELARDFFRIFKKMWWLFLIFVVAVTGGYGLYSYLTYTPLYQCSATFTVPFPPNARYGALRYSISSISSVVAFPAAMHDSHFCNILS